MDISHSLGVMGICSGKVLYILNLESMTVLFKLGRVTGSVHKENLTGCAFNGNGSKIASCSLDKKVVIWDSKTQKALKVLEGHKGEVYQVKFSADGLLIYSSSEDGKILIWDWTSGAIVGSFIRHPSSIRCFCFSPEVPLKLIVGRNDGNVSAWDLEHRVEFDKIMADPSWTDRGSDSAGRDDKLNHHSGAINCVKISSNFHYLATGCADHTCKLWNIGSYIKEFAFVEKENRESKEAQEKLSGYIDVTSDEYLTQLKQKYFFALKGGEVPIHSGFHGDLLFTYIHDGPVLAIEFNAESDIVITGSTDCTCRLWSAKRGELLFQINTPSHVSHLYVNPENVIYASCQNRLLSFGIQAFSKETDLPTFWQNKEIEQAFEQFDTENSNLLARAEPPKMATASKPSSDSKEELLISAIGTASAAGSNAPAPSLKTKESEKMVQFVEPIDNQEKEFEEMRKKLQTRELRKLISLGLALPSLLNTLLEQFSDIDGDQLHNNLKKYNIQPRQILKVIANTDFKIEDTLRALASKNHVKADAIYGLIGRNETLYNFMVSNGFKSIDPVIELEANEVDIAHLRDFRIMTRSTIDRTKTRGSVNQSTEGADEFSNRSRPNTHNGGDYLSVFDDNDEFAGQFAEIPKYDANGLPKGSVLHFIPSEQIKLIKDYQHNRSIKPIFMRQLMMSNTSTPAVSYPNFSMDSEYSDVKAMSVQPTIPQQGVRFNEPLRKNLTVPILPIQAKLSEKELIEKYILGPDGLRKVVVNAKNEMQKYPNGGLLPRPAAIPPKQQTEGFSNQLMKNFNSSRTLFKPDRYLQTRGISVSFDEINDTGSKLQLQSIEETDGARGRSSKLYVGKVLTQKLAFRESVTDKNLKEAMIVGSSVKVREQSAHVRNAVKEDAEK